MTPAVRRERGPALLLALSVGLVLADSSVVTLALPSILRHFDCGVPAVAWVLIAFNLALAVVAVPGWRLARARPRVAFSAATAGFAAASIACATAPSLGVLIAARAAQGVIGAVVVASALALLTRAVPRHRAIGMWAAAGVLGGAIGPAVGGVLTEALSWQAMFALQAPVALLALAGARGLGGPEDVAAPAAAGSPPASPRVASDPGEAVAAPAAGSSRGVPLLGRGPGEAVAVAATGSLPVVPLVALTLVSAALSAALFLLVVMLIEGWRLSPGAAALVVTAMPVAALVAGRWAREQHRLAPALPGSVLLAGGLAALGLLPGTGAAWTIAPQMAIGAGLGLALGALIGVIVEAGGAGSSRAAAWTIAARHAGVVIGLLVLTPIFTADLEAARAPAERAGLAHVLDATIALKPKLALARSLSGVLQRSTAQLPDLGAAFAAVTVPAVDRAGTQRLRAQLDDDLDRSATSAFSRAFLVAALLALLAAAAVAVAVMRARPPTTATGSNGSRLHPPPSLNVALPAACAVATLLVAAYVALGGAHYGPRPVADPCAQRARPAVDATQRVALATIDGAACALHTSRETMLLALLGDRRPAGATDAGFTSAILAGIDRAEREGQLGTLAAFALKLAVRASGALGVTGRLLPH